MVKVDINYNDEAATKNPPGGNFSPSYGVFTAKITKVKPTKNNFEVKTTSNGHPYYTCILEFSFAKNGEVKKKGYCLNAGIWFPPLTKQLLTAVGMATKEGRTAIMSDTNALVGNELQIVIGAKKDNYKEDFEGYQVGEYNGKKFIANEIIGFHKKGEKVNFDEGREIAIREKFKQYQCSGVVQKTEPTVEDLPF